MSRVLIKEGGDARTLGGIYVTVAQAIMIYGSETWVMTPHIRMVLGRLHHRVAYRMMGRQSWIGQDIGWVHTPLEDAMAEEGLLEMETYVSPHQNAFAQFIVTSPIMDLCLAPEGRQGSRVANWWWEQYGLDLEGMWPAYWEAEWIEGG